MRRSVGCETPVSIPGLLRQLLAPSPSLFGAGESPQNCPHRLRKGIDAFFSPLAVSDDGREEDESAIDGRIEALVAGAARTLEGPAPMQAVILRGLVVRLCAMRDGPTRRVAKRLLFLVLLLAPSTARSAQPSIGGSDDSINNTEGAFGSSETQPRGHPYFCSGRLWLPRSLVPAIESARACTAATRWSCAPDPIVQLAFSASRGSTDESPEGRRWVGTAPTWKNDRERSNGSNSNNSAARVRNNGRSSCAATALLDEGADGGRRSRWTIDWRQSSGDDEDAEVPSRGGGGGRGRATTHSWSPFSTPDKPPRVSLSRKADEGSDSGLVTAAATTPEKVQYAPVGALFTSALSSAALPALFVACHCAAAGRIDPYGLVEVVVDTDLRRRTPFGRLDDTCSSSTAREGNADEDAGRKIEEEEEEDDDDEAADVGKLVLSSDHAKASGACDTESDRSSSDDLSVGGTQSALGGLLRSHCAVGTHLLRLHRFARAASTASGQRRHQLGSFGAAAISALRSRLEGFEASVCASFEEVAGLRQISLADVLAAHRRLSSAAVAVSALGELFLVPANGHWRVATSLATCGSATFLSRLHAHTNRGFDARWSARQMESGSVARAVLHAAMQPLNAMVTRWLHGGGEIRDPFDEFFIAKHAPGANAGAGSSFRYLVRTSRRFLPSFVSEDAAQLLLEAGAAKRALSISLRHFRTVASALEAEKDGRDASASQGEGDDGDALVLTPAEIGDNLEFFLRFDAPAVSPASATKCLDAWVAYFRGATSVGFVEGHRQPGSSVVARRPEVALPRGREAERPPRPPPPPPPPTASKTEEENAQEATGSTEPPTAAPATTFDSSRPGTSAVASNAADGSVFASDEEVRRLTAIARQRILVEHDTRMRETSLHSARLDWRLRRLAMSAQRDRCVAQSAEELLLAACAVLPLKKARVGDALLVAADASWEGVIESGLEPNLEKEAEEEEEKKLPTAGTLEGGEQESEREGDLQSPPLGLISNHHEGREGGSRSPLPDTDFVLPPVPMLDDGPPRTNNNGSTAISAASAVPPLAMDGESMSLRGAPSRMPLLAEVPSPAFVAATVGDNLHEEANDGVHVAEDHLETVSCPEQTHILPAAPYDPLADHLLRVYPRDQCESADTIIGASVFRGLGLGVSPSDVVDALIAEHNALVEDQIGHQATSNRNRLALVLTSPPLSSLNVRGKLALPWSPPGKWRGFYFGERLQIDHQPSPAHTPFTTSEEPDVSAFFTRLSLSACRFYTRSALQWCVSLQGGLLRHVVDALMDVCLMQGAGPGLRLQLEWIDACRLCCDEQHRATTTTPAWSDGRVFGTINATLLAHQLSTVFSRLWSEPLRRSGSAESRAPPASLLPLVVRWHAATAAADPTGGAGAPSRTAAAPSTGGVATSLSDPRALNSVFDVLPALTLAVAPRSTVPPHQRSRKRLGDGQSAAASDCPASMSRIAADSGEEGSEFPLWLFPGDGVRRYGDLMLTLLLWTWVDDVCKSLWRSAMQLDTAEAWLFVKLSMAVFRALIDHAYLGVGQACRTFRAKLATCDTRASTLGGAIEEHDQFLTECFVFALLAPHHQRVRKLIRSLVTLLSETEAFFSQQVRQAPDRVATTANAGPRRRDQENRSSASRQPGREEGSGGAAPASSAVSSTLQRRLMKEFVKKRTSDFLATSEVLVRHLDDCIRTTDSSAKTLRASLWATISSMGGVHPT